MQSRFFGFLKQLKGSVNIVCKDEKEILALAEVAKFLGFQTYSLSDIRLEPGEDTKSFFKELFSISATLYHYHNDESDKKILFIPYHTALHKLPSKQNLKAFLLDKSQKTNQNDLINYLSLSGYERVASICDIGEFSVNGDKVDIFCEDAYRILFFDDEIESIRRIDLDTLKSVKDELSSTTIIPFLSYLKQDEYDKVMDKINSLDAISKDINSFGFWFIDGFVSYVDDRTFRLDELESLNEIKLIKSQSGLSDLNITISDDFFALNKDKNITLFYAYDSLLERFSYIKNYQNIKLVKSDLVLNIKSGDELYVSLNSFKQKSKKPRKTIGINDLNVGDFVTHEVYGVGKFMGLKLVDVDGVSSEMVHIIYQNDDSLYLPTANLHLLDKYIFNNTPNLDKLGKNSFAKTKEKLAKHLSELAEQISALAAARALKVGTFIDYPKNYAAFLSSAGFTHTDDQSKVIEEIFDDFKSKKLMDRLLSADVGFGKTEVAANALYACASAGYRACFLAPTTLLSSQHYETLKNRFKGFDIGLYKLDRFSTTKEKNELKKAIANNESFVVVGTHSLFSLECEYALVVIDEEHKFGVKQKEKLKDISKNAHVLSMSATPIPRSLSQALSSIKTYSTINTPPLHKQDTKTFLKEKSDALLKEAISRELRRGGQVFYIHNHIKSIVNVAKELKDLMPNLRILILHAQLSSTDIEDGMKDFKEHKYDLLLSTSIVESGIDLSNANTMIVDNAQNFGLSDLHQLRGRVGRGENVGYCYYLVDDKNELTPMATKRLSSLVSNSYLGAGSVLAYHDLEIRGGGNLLGVDQSGKIEGVGYALYIKMLEEKINELSKKDEKKQVDLKLMVSAFINKELVEDDSVRLELYKRLSLAKSISGILDIAEEIEDRFGKIDNYSKNYLDMMKIKIMCLKNDIKYISNFGQNIKLVDTKDNSAILKAKSNDDDDILACILEYFYAKGKNIS